MRNFVCLVQGYNIYIEIPFHNIESYLILRVLMINFDV